MKLEETKFIWMDGKLHPWNDARIHAMTHSFHYGGGVFEGIKAYDHDGRVGIFRLTDHIERLFRSAKVLMLDIEFSVDQLVAATKNVVRENELRNCYIRPLAFRGYGEIGLDPTHAPPSVMVAAFPFGSYLNSDSKGIRAMVSAWRRHDPNICPPTVKATGMYINSSLAKVDATRSGFDEAIMLNTDGFVAEATGQNIFVVQKGVLITPPSSAGALEGIRRDSVMTLAKEAGIEVKIDNLRRTDLYLADEIFLTGTASEVVPVQSVDNREVPSTGSITKLMMDQMSQATRGLNPNHVDWFELI